MSLTARPTPAGRMAEYAPGISAPYGFSPQYKNGKVFHHGQDYFWLNADIIGSRKVYAAGSGTVTKVFWSDTMGGCIEISHGLFSTRYNHMPKGSSRVKIGDKVTTNTYLGPMGNAGTAANGQYHLHFEVWVNGTRVDPAPYFTIPTGGGTPIPEGNPVKKVYKTTTGTNKLPLWALADDEAIDPVNSGWIETRDTNVAEGWLARYGAFIMLSEAQFAEYRIKFRSTQSSGGGGMTDEQFITLNTKLDSISVLISKIPTATENGAAARTAIVK
jgi:Membrane proteins related to metalloendopeptidases